jgi:DNA-binding transcriptional LysR family regulator
MLRRTTRRLAPTVADQQLYEHGVRMLAEMDAARSAIDSLGYTVRGHVRLSIPGGLVRSTSPSACSPFSSCTPRSPCACCSRTGCST